jgi:hypothetical protein
MLMFLGDLRAHSSQYDIWGATATAIFLPVVAFLVAVSMLTMGRPAALRKENLVRAMNTLPTLMPVATHFSAVSLGLYVGLWVLTVVLMPLESDTLPSDYPDYFDAERPAPGL